MSIQSCSVMQSEVLEFTSLERTCFQCLWVQDILWVKQHNGNTHVLFCIYLFIGKWLFPGVFDPVMQRQRVWCLPPLLQDIYWSWRNGSGGCGECPIPLVKADVQVSPGAWEICGPWCCLLFCLFKHFFNSARSETVWPNHVVHDFWTLLNYYYQKQMKRYKNKEGSQMEIAYMRHAGGNTKLSVAEFSMENKIKCFQLQEGRPFPFFLRESLL